jgi:hypothetical protein
MIRKSRFGRLASMRRQTLVVTMALVASLAALSVASPALATPKGEFAIFADCPLSNAELSACLTASTESGEFTVGKKTVPITNTITLQGGFIESESGAQTFVGAADGNTLSKTPQTVPGGLFGIIAPKEWPEWLQKLFNEFINKGITGVTATTELAAPASSIGLDEENLLSETGTALSLPVKLHLNNTFLGSECYIGSNSSPIIINLTTGTSGSLKGSRGTLGTNPEGNILIVSKNSLVNNTFAAPGVNGCGGELSFLIDPAVNAELGLPAAAGHNKAVLNGTLKQSSAEVVRAHE